LRPIFRVIPESYQSGAVVIDTEQVEPHELGARDRLSHDAINALRLRMPEFSAYQVVTRAQAIAIIAGASVVACATAVWPSVLAEILVAGMSAGFIVSTGFRAFLAWNGLRETAEHRPATNEGTLPVYTILVPLYHEAAMVPQLTRALSSMDYPCDKLDIKLIVEEDDRETRAAVEAFSLPFETIIVPFSLPRTKPKACNYALHFARGEYAVIFDAEDRPESDQLRKAVKCFRQAPPTVACVQARLGIYNERGWLQKMFALDYGIWFRTLLPGLDRFAVPIPLGGTSNHFRTQILRAAGAWDPFNVTEDADLGIRLARMGYRVSMLDSTTFEEAPTRLGSWFRQRSRWLKGYMQTVLVHARDPLLLRRSVGFRGVAMIQLFLGGAVWSALVNPLLWLIFAVSCVSSCAGDGPNALDHVARISGIGLLVSNTTLAALSVVQTQRAEWLHVIPYGLSYPVYWVLISAAAYRGLWQLVFKPFYWEKTTHGEASA
jgi:glycosyltransferase XagB